MSIRATNWVRRLRGLTIAQKAVAFVLADHHNYKLDRCDPSMTTVAEEAGFTYRQNASETVQQLVELKVIYSPRPSKGRAPTNWCFNYELAKSGSPISVAPINRSPGVAVENAQPQSEADPTAVGTPVENGPTAVQNDLNRSLGTAQRVLKGKERKGKTEGGTDGSLRSLPSALQPQVAKMIATLQTWLHMVQVEKHDPYERERNLEIGYESFKKAANAIGLDFESMTELYNRTIREFFH